MSLDTGSSSASAPSTPSAQSTPQSGSQKADPKGLSLGSPAPGKEGAPAKAAAPQEEEFEEIKVGGTQARLPKAIAKAVKELEKGFQTKAQESAAKDRLLQNFAKAAKENPDVFFERFGIDPDQYSQARLAKKLELEMLSPEQKKLREYEQKVKSYEEREKAEKERAERETRTAAEAKEDASMRNELVEAWKDSELPPDPRFGSWIAATVLREQNQGRNLTFKEAAGIVKKDWLDHVNSTAATLPPERLQDLVGESALKKWRDWDVKRVTGAQPPSTQRQGSQPSSDQKKVSKPLNEKEWLEKFSKL